MNRPYKIQVFWERMIKLDMDLLDSEENLDVGLEEDGGWMGQEMETGQEDAAGQEAAPPPDAVPEERPPETLRGELSEFLEAFPEVKGEELPPEVWQAVAAGKNLTLAYSLNRNQALERELAARRQAEQNRQRSTGSLARNAPGTAEDLIAAWWNEA